LRLTEPDKKLSGHGNSRCEDVARERLGDKELLPVWTAEAEVGEVVMVWVL